MTDVHCSLFFRNLCILSTEDSDFRLPEVLVGELWLVPSTLDVAVNWHIGAYFRTFNLNDTRD